MLRVVEICGIFLVQAHDALTGKALCGKLKTRSGDIISQYVAFTKVYQKQIEQYGKTQKAVSGNGLAS